MLDGWVRIRIDPLLDRAAKPIAAAGVSANGVTLAACAVGLLAAAAIAAQWYLAGLALILLSRIGDGLDGAVARISGKTDLGGYLDIVLDFLFYGAVPIGFVLADPPANAVAGAVLLFSFYVNGASFLAYAAMAEKRKLATDHARDQSRCSSRPGLPRPPKPSWCSAAFCLVPTWFPEIAYAFAALTFYTALSRIVLAVKDVPLIAVHRAAFSAISMSSIRSSASSRPIEMRSVPGPMPSSARASSVRFLCVVVAGCVIRLLASPRLLEMRTISSAFSKSKAAFLPALRSKQIRVDPPVICLAMMSACGWSGLPG